MKIALLTSSLAPYRISGAERQAVETAIRLAGRGHEVVVFARRMLPEQPKVEERAGVRWVCCPVVHLPGLSFLSHVASFLGAWKGEQERGPFDCVLAYSMVINGVLGRLAAARHHIPLVVSVRSEAEISLRKNRKFRYFTPWVLAKTSHLLLQAENIRRNMLFELQAAHKTELHERFKKQSSVLANAIALGPKPAYEGRRGVVFAGRLMPVKGIDLLFQALRQLDPPPELNLVGDGPLREELEKLGEGLPLTFHGYLQPEQVAERMARAKVLAAPSYVEGFPNVILEGMAQGTPAVASDVGGVSTLIKNGHNGFMIAPGDVAGLKEKLELLLKDEALRESLARNARATAETFAWDPHIDTLEGILRNACSATRS